MKRHPEMARKSSVERLDVIRGVIGKCCMGLAAAGAAGVVGTEALVENYVITSEAQYEVGMASSLGSMLFFVAATGVNEVLRNRAAARFEAITAPFQRDPELAQLERMFPEDAPTPTSTD